MESNSSKVSDNWAAPIARMYFQTAAAGYPYIDCPTELRPDKDDPTAWWVIYAPRYNGGFIVEGYRIDEWKERQSRGWLMWVILGVTLWLGLALSGTVVATLRAMGPFDWIGYVLICVLFLLWVLAYFAFIGWWFIRPVLRKSEWVSFPADLQQALKEEAIRMNAAQSKAVSRNIAAQMAGKGLGAISGALIGTGAGQTVGRLSEVALEQIFEKLAHGLLKKF